MSTCEAKIGHLSIPVSDSVDQTWGCPDQATVTLRAACIHEHVREKRFCARHGQEAPPDGVWLCLPCAQAGHDCPIHPEVVSTT